jgi:hypothetical protein
LRDNLERRDLILVEELDCQATEQSRKVRAPANRRTTKATPKPEARLGRVVAKPKPKARLAPVVAKPKPKARVERAAEAGLKRKAREARHPPPVPASLQGEDLFRRA